MRWPSLTNVGHVGATLPGQLGDMAEAFLAGQDFDEGAEVHDPLYQAVVDAATSGSSTIPMTAALASSAFFEVLP
jgi:hypothetical protein